MHTVQNHKLSKTKQLYSCDKQGRTAMPLIILKCENQLEKMRIIFAVLTKMACRIFSFWCRILTTLVLTSELSFSSDRFDLRL